MTVTLAGDTAIAKSVTINVAWVVSSREPETAMMENVDVPMAVAAVVDSVKVDMAALAPGVTVLSEKAQDVSAERSEHDSDTGSSKVPPTGVTVTVYVAACPWVTLAVSGVTAIVKSVTVNRAVVECSIDPEVPATVKVAVPVGVAGSVETVRVETTAPAPGETLAGEKSQVLSAGRFEHESTMSPSKVPPSASMVTV